MKNVCFIKGWVSVYDHDLFLYFAGSLNKQLSCYPDGTDEGTLRVLDFSPVIIIHLIIHCTKFTN